MSCRPIRKPNLPRRSDQTLVKAMNFIIAHERDSKKYLEATLDLSFASAKWQRTVLVRRKRKSWYIRQHLETCVFSYVAEELKTGGLCGRLRAVR